MIGTLTPAEPAKTPAVSPATEAVPLSRKLPSPVSCNGVVPMTSEPEKVVRPESEPAMRVPALLVLKDQ